MRFSKMDHESNFLFFEIFTKSMSHGYMSQRILRSFYCSDNASILVIPLWLMVVEKIQKMDLGPKSGFLHYLTLAPPADIFGLFKCFHFKQKYLFYNMHARTKINAFPRLKKMSKINFSKFCSGAANFAPVLSTTRWYRSVQTYGLKQLRGVYCI